MVLRYTTISEKHEEKLSNMIYYTAQVKCKSWLELDLNSHLRDSGPPLYLLSYRANRDWRRVLSISSSRNISRRLIERYPSEVVQCFDSVTKPPSEKHEEKIVEFPTFTKELRESYYNLLEIFYKFLWGWFCNRIETLHILAWIAFKS